MLNVSQREASSWGQSRLGKYLWETGHWCHGEKKSSVVFSTAKKFHKLWCPIRFSNLLGLIWDTCLKCISQVSWCNWPLCCLIKHWYKTLSDNYKDTEIDGWLKWWREGWMEGRMDTCMDPNLFKLQVSSQIHKRILSKLGIRFNKCSTIQTVPLQWHCAYGLGSKLR